MKIRKGSKAFVLTLYITKEFKKYNYLLEIRQENLLLAREAFHLQSVFSEMRLFDDLQKNMYMLEEMPTKEDLSTRLPLLLGLGTWLSEAILPPKLKERFVQFSGKNARMLIIEHEHKWPWELCVIDPDKVIYLGENYRIQRWFPTVVHRAFLPPKNMLIMMPPNTDPNFYQEAVEIKKLCKRFNIKLKLHMKPMTEAWSKGYDIIHLLSHGQFDWRQAAPGQPDGLGMSTRKAFLCPANVEGEPGPLVFLNACELGIHLRKGTGVEGFPLSALVWGASHVIAAWGRVHGPCAMLFAVKFYEALFQGYTPELAMASARDALWEKGEHEALYYTHFGSSI